MEKLIQITSGRGPAECCWVVAQVLKKLIQEAQNQGIKHDIVDRQTGNENRTLVSATIQLNGNDLTSFLESWVGTIKWVGQSQFRKHHKRKNWFVGVNEIDPIGLNLKLNHNDIQFEAIRSGGPGGQHVNKVSTAVRAKHLPSGLSVLASDSRSQSQNKKKAKERLIQLLQIKDLEAKGDQIRSNWQNHNELERGNPVRTFQGSDFKSNKKRKSFKNKRQRLKQELKRDIP